MLRFLTDEDFDGRLTSALLARVSGLDLVRVQDVGLMHTPDPDILSWAAAEHRIVLSHDRKTMTAFASIRVHASEPMPGLFVVDRQASVARILSDLEAMAAASEMHDWRDQMFHYEAVQQQHHGSIVHDRPMARLHNLSGLPASLRGRRSGGRSPGIARRQRFHLRSPAGRESGSGRRGL
jgi:hypothetical protein